MELSTALALGVLLFAALLVPFLIWAESRGKARGRAWWNWRKPQGHGDIGPDLGDKTASNPYSPEAQARR